MIALIVEECQTQLRQVIETKAVGSIKENHSLRDGLDGHFVCVRIPATKSSIVVKINRLSIVNLL